METGIVTTPFGRRPMTLGMLSSQISAKPIDQDRSVDKWKLYRALCEARGRLGITERSLSLMSALLSFYPKNELSSRNGLIVFPSNAQLSLRAHGMAEQTIRRHLAVLVAAGLITRKDSANGKRYSRRDRSGTIQDAFGFSLAPLLARAAEIESVAQDIIAEQMAHRSLREHLTITRRDISKLLEMLPTGIAKTELTTLQLQRDSVLAGLPRKASVAQLRQVVNALETIRDKIINLLDFRTKSQNMGGKDYQNERHIQSSDIDSHSESEVLPNPTPVTHTQHRATTTTNKRPATISLDMLLKACPEIAHYGPGGKIGNWRDLMIASTVVSRMMAITPDTHQQALQVLGVENAAATIACLLQKAGHIHSAGGYLRDLTKRARNGHFSPQPMLMALWRQQSPGNLQ